MPPMGAADCRLARSLLRDGLPCCRMLCRHVRRVACCVLSCWLCCVPAVYGVRCATATTGRACAGLRCAAVCRWVRGGGYLSLFVAISFARLLCVSVRYSVRYRLRSSSSSSSRHCVSTVYHSDTCYPFAFTHSILRISFAPLRAPLSHCVLRRLRCVSLQLYTTVTFIYSLI